MGIIILGFICSAFSIHLVVLPHGAVKGSAKISAVFVNCKESPGWVSVLRTVMALFSGAFVSQMRSWEADSKEIMSGREVWETICSSSSFFLTDRLVMIFTFGNFFTS